MPRPLRRAPAGYWYHVINRSAGKFPMFRKEQDFLAFYRILAECHACTPLPIAAFCIMSNHWHFLVKPTTDTQLTEFFRWLANTHAVRFRVNRGTVGWGHLYQGRFKHFPIQDSAHFLNIARYIERNPLTAGIVERAEDYRWSSLAVRTHGEAPELFRPEILAPWPVRCPANWLSVVNAVWNEKELARIRTCVNRQQPYGDAAWAERSAAKFGLKQSLRAPGRPRKDADQKGNKALVSENGV